MLVIGTSLDSIDTVNISLSSSCLSKAQLPFGYAPSIHHGKVHVPPMWKIRLARMKSLATY